VPSRVCLVSFRDYRQLEHSVEVSAESLFEAAALALQHFRSSDLADGVAPGRLTVTVKQSESHQIEVDRVMDWLRCMGRSPREQALKTRLNELLGPGWPSDAGC
jgi:hypothetical protein